MQKKRRAKPFGANMSALRLSGWSRITTRFRLRRRRARLNGVSLHSANFCTRSAPDGRLRELHAAAKFGLSSFPLILQQVGYASACPDKLTKALGKLKHTPPGAAAPCR